MAPLIIRTLCRHGHEMTPENTYLNPAGYAVCRICNREAGARWIRKNYRRLRADPLWVARKRGEGRLFKKRHPEREQRWQREQHQKLRRQVLLLYGGQCVRCGFVDERALQLDHVNGGGHKEHRTRGWVMVYKRAIEQHGMGEFQLLCANCNRIKAHEKGETRAYRY